MPFQNQFSLSLELTRIAPVGLVLSKAAQALMSLARDLQNSGSDIVIEEDLANIFGRCRISSEISSSFKTIILQSSSPPTLLDSGIALITGAGPTVARALQETPYYATIVQASLLMSTHDKISLAQAIHETMESNQKGAPPENIPRAPPPTSGILGVLRAIEEQTAAYGWSGHLRAVYEMLPAVGKQDTIGAMPQAILAGALNMLPMVQSLPLDRLIYVQGFEGICTLIVWAHHVLGLNVLVKTFGPSKDIKFGGNREGDEQVIIDMAGKQSYEAISTPCITLLDACSKEELFRLMAEPQDPPLDSCFKIPAKGFGSYILGDSLYMKAGSEELRASVLHEMSLVSASFALILAAHLVPGGNRQSRWIVSNQSVLGSARFLFDNKMSEKSILEYVTTYSSRPLDHSLAPPAPMVSWLARLWSEYADPKETKNYTDYKEDRKEPWGRLVYCARILACLVLALAHVRDLNACDELPFNGYYVSGTLGSAPFALRTENWNGTTEITVLEDSWLNIISLLMTGHRFGADSYDMFEDQGSVATFNRTCLISDRGWSLYIPTITTMDPFLVDRDHMRISKGVPCRNGVLKHEIIDGPTQKTNHGAAGWLLVDRAGDTANLSRPGRVYFQPSLCGDHEGAFIVTVRLADEVNMHTLVRRTGYRQFHGALHNVEKTEKCKHSSQTTDRLVLSPGCSTVEGFGDGSERDGKVTICLTSGGRSARWRAIIATAYEPPPNVRICLRGRDCCYECAIDHVAKQPGKWFLIL